MLTVYARAADGLVKPAPDPWEALRSGAAVWVDLLNPSPEEEAKVEATLGFDAPTPAERAAIEESARFYEENGTLVLTPTLFAHTPSGAPTSGGVTFMLAGGRLITARAIEPRAFLIGAGRASARIENAADGADVLVALIEGYVERVADILQDGAARASAVTQTVFDSPDAHPDMRTALTRLALLGSIATLARDSLSSIQRMAAYAGHVCQAHGVSTAALAAIARDANELERAAEGAQNHLTFLLEASLGLVASGQNVSLQRLSVAAILFAPATLVASIFGMNFEAMDWFNAPWGPWAAFALMVSGSAAVLLFARARHWV